MSADAWITVAVIALVMVVLVSGRVSTDVAMLGGLTLLMLAGVVPVGSAIAGFAHPAVLLIASLFVIAAGLKQTGAAEMLAQRVLGEPESLPRAQLRMMLPVAFMSGFMNNTAVVALYLPILTQWARKLRISPSRLYMPLSFAANLGGKISLIGTASNVVVMTLYVAYLAAPENQAWLAEIGAGGLSGPAQFWGVAALGVPTTLLGIGFIVLASRWLPERKPAELSFRDAREYQVEMMVQPDSPIVGRTIEEAGLRRLPGLFLSEVTRDGTIFPAVSPNMQLLAGDRLGFVGVLESVVDLRKIRGLVPATEEVNRVKGDQQQRALVEAVVSHSSPVVGRSVRDSKFRTVYNAAIIAVHRRGRELGGKIGDIVLEPGDVLLLEAHAGFVSAHRNNKAFYLVSQVEGSQPLRHHRAGWALAILLLLVAALTVTPGSEVVVGLSCAVLMVVAGCVTAADARSSLNRQVIISIAAALGIGSALQHTGAAASIGHAIIGLGQGMGPQAMLLVVFVLAALFSLVITNNGAAVVVFPIAMTVARDLGVSPHPFAFVLMVGAGSNYISPATYQTHLMVWGPGGYRFGDFARIGAPLTILLALICTLVAPLVFPF